MELNSLAQILTEVATQNSGRIAIKIKDETLTYHELLHKSAQVANTLKGLGANKVAIGVVGQRHMASYIGILGVLLAGCYYVPISPKLNKDKALSIINDSEIRFLIGDVDNFSEMSNVLNDCDLIDKKILPVESALTGEEWIGSKDVSDKSSEIEINNIKANDLAYIIYTSGSTGNPKGVMVTNANVLSLIENMSLLYDCKPGFVASQSHDLSFDFSVSDVFNTWANGGVLCVLPEEEKFYPAEFIIRESIEFWSAVPTLLKFMDGLGGLQEGAFPSIKHTIFCGEPLPIKLARNWRKAAPNSVVRNLYGPTEATVFITKYEVDSGTDEEVGYSPIGKPFNRHSIEVVDSEGNKQDYGFKGELVLSGPQIANGYLNDAEKTKIAFVKFDWDPSGGIWYKTGDLGLYNKQGDLECVGRNDNQIKIGGRRIEIGEIEAVLSNFPLLSDVVIVSIKDANQISSSLVAFTTNEISKEDLSQIRQDSQKFIEKIFFPKKIITVNKFPRLSSGKIDRKTLSLKAESL